LKDFVMKRFNIEYFTACNESLWICFDGAERLPMQCCGNGQWSIEADAEVGATYSYELCSADGEVVRSEEFGKHSVAVSCDAEIFDHWLEIPSSKPFYSTLFTEGVFRRDNRSKELEVEENQIVVNVDAPTLRPNEVLAIVGEAAEMGHWRVDNALVMNDSNAPTWSIALPVNTKGSEYKFVILDSSSNTLIQFEEGDNRIVPTSDYNVLIISML
jgi:4-alpha-glucanotransferase